MNENKLMQEAMALEKHCRLLSCDTAHHELDIRKGVSISTKLDEAILQAARDLAALVMEANI